MFAHMRPLEICPKNQLNSPPLLGLAMGEPGLLSALSLEDLSLLGSVAYL